MYFHTSRALNREKMSGTDGTKNANEQAGEGEESYLQGISHQKQPGGEHDQG